MKAPNSIPAQRLANHALTGPARRGAADVVQWLGAVQAQEFVPVQWGLALRMRPGVTLRDTLRAHDAGRILRTHVLRPTWHFVARQDIRWMLELSAAGVHKRMAVYDRRLGLTPALCARAGRVCERALESGGFLTRQELRQHLARAGIRTDNIQLAHIMLWLELEAVITSGPRRGKDHTYALLDLRAKGAKSLPRDESLGLLARRYFRSHGPATIQDFMWWSGLGAADARRAAEIARARPFMGEHGAYHTLGTLPAVRKRRVHLLPIYDEYTVAYRRREAVPHAAALVRSPKGGYAQFQHTILIDGQVAGTWRTSRENGRTRVEILPLAKLSSTDARAVDLEARRFGRFVAI